LQLKKSSTSTQSDELMLVALDSLLAYLLILLEYSAGTHNVTTFCTVASKDMLWSP
jgi:hypothetical protein